MSIENLRSEIRSVENKIKLLKSSLIQNADTEDSIQELYDQKWSLEKAVSDKLKRAEVPER